jgi:hypothetical protein
VIDTKLGIFGRRLGFQRATQATTRAVGIAIHQKTHHVDDVLFRASQPILQSQKIGAHILGRTGNKAQDFRHTPQHFHLPLARCGARIAFATQFFQHRHGPGGLFAHVEAADSR